MDFFRVVVVDEEEAFKKVVGLPDASILVMAYPIGMLVLVWLKGGNGKLKRIGPSSRDRPR